MNGVVGDRQGDAHPAGAIGTHRQAEREPAAEPLRLLGRQGCPAGHERVAPLGNLEGERGRRARAAGDDVGEPVERGQAEGDEEDPEQPEQGQA